MKTRKLFSKLFLFVLVLATAFTVAACGDNTETPGPSGESTVTSVTLNPTTATITVGEELNYSDFKITVNYLNETTQEVTLTESMISGEDLALLGTVGTHALTVTVMGKTATLTVTVNPRTMENVTLKGVTKTYDGVRVTPQVTGLPLNAQVEYAYYAGETADESNRVDEIVDAGTYFVKATVTASGYDPKELTATVVINKKHIAADALHWNNTGYVHTGSEITLAATAEELPEGFTVTFEDEDGNPAKATDKGYYTAIAKITGSNKNYTVDATCTLTWRIVASAAVDLEPWYGAKEGQLLTATFAKGATDADVTMTFGDDTVTGTVEYNGTNAVVTLPDSGYTVTVTNGVLKIEKDNQITYLIAESELNQFVGEYSTIVEDLTIAVDHAAETLSFVQTRRGEASVAKEITLDYVNGKVQLNVDGTNFKIVFNSTWGAVQLQNYSNPADFFKTSDMYLPLKSVVDNFIDNLLFGEFVKYDGTTLTVNSDLSVLYNGNIANLYAKGDYSNTDVDYKLVIHSYSDKDIGVEDGVYTCGSYSKEYYIPAAYKDFFGVYNAKENGEFVSGEKVSFMEYDRKFGVTIGTKTYNVDPADIALTEDTLTAVIEDNITVVFTKTSASYNDKTYYKVSSLIEPLGYVGNMYVSAAGEKVMYSGTSTNNLTDGKIATFRIGDEVSSDFTVQYTAEGTQITVNIGGAQKVIVKGDDARYITVDGVLYVHNDLESDAAGRSTVTYYSGDNTIAFNSSSNKYTLTTADGDSAELTDMAYAFVDDGNGKGRTILKVTGKVGTTEYTILHYSLLTVKVNDDVYVAEEYAGLYGSEFKPTADSEDIFAFTTEGKVTFRGEEIFFFTNSSSGRFYYASENGLYYVSVDMYASRIRLHNYADIDNAYYYYTAYFDYSGAYVSTDGTKVFYFGADTLYYNETSSTKFSAVMNGENGAELTVDGKDAVITKVAGGAHTLVFDGVTYTKVADFNMASYYGTYTAFDGSANGQNLTVNATTQIRKFVMHDNAITPVVYVGYNNYYLLPNKDSATSANLPVLAVQEKFVEIVGTSTLDNKPFEVAIQVVQKSGSTGFMPVVVVLYDGETASISGSFSPFNVTLNDTVYKFEVNDDETTKAALPLIVYEAWWYDFTGSYTYNGKVTKIDIIVDATGATPAPVLQFTFEDEVVEVTMTDVQGAADVKNITFSKDDVAYKGIMNTNATPKVAVYTEAEFNFFFATDNTNVVNNKDLVLVVKPTSSATTFDLTGSTYDGKALTSALYLASGEVVIFASEDGSYAYDIGTKQFWSDVIAADDAPLIGLNYSYPYSYGNPLSSTTIKSEISEFDKTTGKAKLIVKTGGSWSQSEVTSINKVADGEYHIVGKTSNSSYTDVSMYLIISGTTVTLYLAEEYTFPGTYTVDGKNLVIAKSGTSYTAAYDGGAAVAITPDFSARKFLLKTTDATYLVAWTYTTDFEFTMTQVSEEALAFEGYGYAYFNGVSGYPYELTIAFKGLNADGKTEYNVSYEMGSSSGTVTGTLSDNGQYIIATVNRNSVWIFKNAISDYDTEFVMLTSCNARNLVGEYTVGTTKVVIGIGVESSYDYDDEFDGFETPKFIVKVDGATAIVLTRWSASVSEISFVGGNKKYTATYASGTGVTVAEDTSAAAFAGSYEKWAMAKETIGSIEYDNDMTIAVTGYSDSGAAQYSIRWTKTWNTSGTTTGTLSADGTHIVVADAIDGKTVAIYLNQNSGNDLKYIAVATDDAAVNLLGTFTMGTSKVVIGLDFTPTTKYDDYEEEDYVDGYSGAKFSVTVDGVAATDVTSWSTTATSIEFTADGTTYVATYASGSVTIAEKVEQAA